MLLPLEIMLLLKFIIPLNFEMLDSLAPYYQTRLRNRLCYEIMFNDYSQVTKSAVASPDAKYKISNISLEYEIVTQPDLTRSIKTEYDEMVSLYDRILRHRPIPVNKSDMTWNWSFNTPCKSSSWFCLRKKSHTQGTQASFTIQTNYLKLNFPGGILFSNSAILFFYIFSFFISVHDGHRLPKLYLSC